MGIKKFLCNPRTKIKRNIYIYSPANFKPPVLFEKETEGLNIKRNLSMDHMEGDKNAVNKTKLDIIDMVTISKSPLK